MKLGTAEDLIKEHQLIASSFLKRNVVVDFYVPLNITDGAELSLLLINDGQDLQTMDFATLLNQLLATHQLQSLLCVGIYASEARKSEYGTACRIDYEGRGATSFLYQQFITEELLPHIHLKYGIEAFKQKGVAGFSLGGLSAMDTVWNYSDLFSIAGVFSGSLWWRTKALDAGYNEDTDRIMHQQIRTGKYKSGLRFYFSTGSLDETADRNNNGIIDSIDDTLALIIELQKKGYNTHDIKYINYEEGRHDIATWGKAMPQFLLWAFGK